MNAWTTLLAVGTAVFELLFKLSPVVDIYKVNKRKHIGEMAELPIITLVLSCNVWTWYSLVDNKLFPLSASQTIGVVVGIGFNIVYFRWSPTDKRNQLLKLYEGAGTACGIVILYTVLGLVGILGLSKNTLGTTLGQACVAFSAALFVSPLATLKRVVETKSSASIPINMSTMMVISTALWVVSGILDSDWFLVASNGAGLALGCAQVILYHMYKPGRTDETALPEQDKDVSVVIVSPTCKSSGASGIYKQALSPPAAAI